MATSAECSICYSLETQLLKPTAKCVKNASVCKECIKSHLDIILTGGRLGICANITNIPCCCGTGCSSIFEEPDLAKILNRAQKNKWDEQALIQWTKGEKDFRWCSNPRCGNGVVVYGGEEEYTFFSCSKCNHKTCVRHKMKMHEGISCDDYDKNSTDNSLSLDEISKSTKQCPKCNEAVTKNDGCKRNLV